jgi:SAM-dependent methyltransferase
MMMQSRMVRIGHVTQDCPRVAHAGDVNPSGHAPSRGHIVMPAPGSADLLTMPARGHACVQYRAMKKRTFHEQGHTLTLIARGTHYDLLIGRVPILTSALLGTERAFGRLAPAQASRVLVGGLGFGATLAGVLETVGPGAQVVVVEKLAIVVRLVRGELAKLASGPLDDPRVSLVRDDVVTVIARERELDAILLDVDNGPDSASFRSNARLYRQEGLTAARRALRPGGIYAVWSGYPADAFMDRLQRAKLRPSVLPLEEHGKVQARAYVGEKAR